jgi:hypothetical protein
LEEISMGRTYYTLLWVVPQADAEDVPSLEQLDQQLGPIYAHVMFGTSLERKVIGQTAIRIFGAADEATVLAKLAELKYEVAGRETRSDPQLMSL